MRKLVESTDQLEFFTVIGTVAGANTWSETSVHTSTRHGYTDSSGYTSSGYTTTSSSSRERNRFFVKRAEDGKEYEVDLYGNAFTVREGHEVGIFYVGMADEGSCYALLFENYSTDKRWMNRRSIEDIRGKTKVAGFVTIAAMILGVVGLLSALAAFSAGDEAAFSAVPELVLPLALGGAVLLALGVIQNSLASKSSKHARMIDAEIIRIGKRHLEERESIITHKLLSSG